MGAERVVIEAEFGGCFHAYPYRFVLTPGPPVRVGVTGEQRGEHIAGSLRLTEQGLEELEQSIDAHRAPDLSFYTSQAYLELELRWIRGETELAREAISDKTGGWEFLTKGTTWLWSLAVQCRASNENDRGVPRDSGRSRPRR